MPAPAAAGYLVPVCVQLSERGSSPEPRRVGRTSLSLLPVRVGPDRSAARSADPFRPWHRIRAVLRIAESRPPGRLWARGPPGRSCPGRQRAVPGTGSRPGLLGYRAGEGGACRAVNMAHTTFPASPGVV